MQKWVKYVWLKNSIGSLAFFLPSNSSLFFTQCFVLFSFFLFLYLVNFHDDYNLGLLLLGSIRVSVWES